MPSPHLCERKRENRQNIRVSHSYRTSFSDQTLVVLLQIIAMLVYYNYYYFVPSVQHRSEIYLMSVTTI